MDASITHRQLLLDALDAINALQADCATRRFDSLCANLRAATADTSSRKHLSKEAIEWLASGDRCSAAETIFTHLTGVDALRGSQPTHPVDTAAFGRCRKLLEACPQVAESFTGMRFVSPYWRALIAEWDDMSRLMDSEAPNWRIHRGTAPETFTRIWAIVQTTSGERP